jgi:hypothetical protein
VLDGVSRGKCHAAAAAAAYRCYCIAATVSLLLLLLYRCYCIAATVSLLLLL